MPIFKRTCPLMVDVLLFSALVLAAGAGANRVESPGQIVSTLEPAPRTLGRFNLASFDGFVSLQNSGNDLIVDIIVDTDVRVGNQVNAGGRNIPSEKIRVLTMSSRCFQFTQRPNS